MSSSAATLSSRHSSDHVPSTKPGARNASIGGRFSFAPYSTVRTFSHACSICIGPAVEGSQPSQPSAQKYSPASTVSVPSERAPATTRWIVALRLPATMFSSRRFIA
jgi:hypothetical protein